MRSSFKTFSAAITLTALFLCGCSTPYVMVMKDGRTIETSDRPEFDSKTGYYEYRTKDGREVKVNKNEVVEFREKGDEEVVSQDKKQDKETKQQATQDKEQVKESK